MARRAFIKRLPPAALVGFALASAPLTASAAGGGGHHEADLTSQLILLVCAVINFAIFLWAINRAAGSPVRDFLSSRRSEVSEAIEAAGKAKAEAEALKAEYEQKVAKLADTKSELVADIKAIAMTERERTLSAANEAAERMRRDAELTAESDLHRARRELREEAAVLATELASKMISEQLDDGARRRLLAEFISKVGASS